MSLNYLANLNPHVRDANISFKDDGHIYTIKHDGVLKEKGEGIQEEGDTGYTSVTTWIHSLFEKFDADKIIDNMMKSSRWPSSKYYGMTKSEIKSQWDANRDSAASAGTKMHYDIECTYNKMPVSNDSVEYKYFLDFYNDYKHLEPYRTEMLVYDEELRLAGSIDMIFRCSNGSLEIYDWKRSKEIVKANPWNKWIKSSVVDHLPDTNYWHYSLQLNTYKAILIKKYGMTVTDLFLVVLHPDNKCYLRIPVPDLQEEVEQLFLERKMK